MSEDKSKLQLIGEIAQANNKNLELIEELNDREDEIERLNNIISKIERLVINHNRDTGDIYYKYNGRYLRSELKDIILELLELKGSDKE